MSKFTVILLLVSFTCFNLYGQPQWKVKYDSAQVFWNINPGKSLQFLQGAERIALNDLGMYDENYLTIISDLGLAYSQIKDFKTAEYYLNQNLTIRNELYPNGDPEVQKARYNLATVVLKSGDDQRATKLFKSIVSQMHNQNQGETYLMAAENVARIYEVNEQLDSALIVLKNALSIQLSDSSLITTYKMMLAEGRILRKNKNYDEARLALIKLTNTSNGVSPSVISIDNALKIELSLIDIEIGLYGKAEKDLLQLYTALINIPDTDQTLLTELTNGLAYAYEKLGVYDKALLYYTESFKRCAFVYGSKSFNCAIIENNIAGIYLKQGLIKESITAYERFIQMIREFSKTNTSVYLIALNNLATAYRQNDQYELALQYFNEAYNILEKRGALQHDLSATVMNNLAVTYMLKADFAKATDYFEKVLVIKERLFGQNSPANFDVVGNLAVAYWVAHRYKDALPLFQKSLALALKEVKYVFPTLTEIEQVQFYQKQKENFERFNTLAVQSASTQPEFLVQMFNNQLLLKSLVFFTSKKRNSLINSKGQEHLKILVDLAQVKGVQLGHFYQMPLNELKTLKISLPAKEQELDSLEKLIRLSMKDQNVNETNIEWKDIRTALKEDEALVDVIRFRKYDVMENKSATTAQRISIGFTDSVWYAILITSKHTTNHPQLVLLKNGNALENRNLKYYRNTLRFDVDDNISYSEYWKPFENYVTGKKKIYISADGVYHQINLNSMHDQNGKCILEKYDLNAILNSSQLNSRKEKEPTDFSSIVLMGDPIFSSYPSDEYTIKIQGQKLREPLPATRDEINGIAAILKPHSNHIEIFVRKSASEVNLKKIRSPSILHIATHGFFSSNVVYLNENVKNKFLFHSGLLLSADNASTATKGSAFDADGIVTAYDVMNLELTNTSLVVLSACDTGLGKIENGEGVYGLQRSFLQAGASDVLISLWKVDDVATKDLMIKFYTYLSQHHNRHEAFKQAQLDMERQVHNPRLWAGFVMVSGD